ncbi:MAG: hypothetical protein KA319_02440 [Ferruginibacter sp.]|nr:hypothetical protein [Ferruginibacter sp.]
MKIKEAILAEHSKAQCVKIVNFIGNNQQRFDELFKLFISDEYRLVQRSAWPVSYCVIAHPNLITKHWKTLIQNLNKPNIHEAVKRNTLRFLQEVEIPEKYHGQLMDYCFTYVNTPTEPIAVKCFGLSVLHNLAKIYPDIKPELKTTIENILPYASAGIKSRATKILKEIK